MSNKRDDSVGEEASALGQRAKGAVKDAVGAVTGNRSLEREGERENAMGRARQATNNVLDESDGVRGASVGSASSGGRMVTGLYRSPEEAQRAYEDLTTRHGYTKDDISVMMSDETRTRHFAGAQPGAELAQGSKALEGAGVGSAIGGTVGAVLAGIAAIGTSILLPGIGLIVAGPLAAALAGAGAGGLTGGLLGALVGSGIPEDRAREYETGLKEGGILIGTSARDDAHAAQLEKDFQTYGGTGVRR